MWKYVTNYVNYLNLGQFIMVGDASTPTGWRSCNGNGTTSRLWNNILAVARTQLGFTGAAAARIGKHVKTIPSINCYNRTAVFVWDLGDCATFDYFELGSKETELERYELLDAFLAMVFSSSSLTIP